jgi:hypothetical protein
LVVTSLRELPPVLRGAARRRAGRAELGAHLELAPGTAPGGVACLICEGAVMGAIGSGGGWLVKAPGTPVAGPLPRLAGFAGLLAADGRATGFLVGAVFFVGVFDDGEVDVGGDLRVHIAGAEYGLQDGFDAAYVALLYFLRVLELADVQAARAGVGRRQQVAGLVDHGDAFGREFGHAAGDQVHDGADLAFVDAAAAVQAQHHGGAGLFLVAHEQRGLGQRQVHARRFDGGDGIDGAREFAFEGALVVDLFGELAGAELLGVHQFEADGAAFGQALGGQAQARLGHLVRRDQQVRRRLRRTCRGCSSAAATR